MNIEKLIEKITTTMVVKLKKSNMITQSEKSAFKKTEAVLRNYNNYKIAINENNDMTIKTQKLINIINKALNDIEDDYYFDIIELIYFKNKTREEVTEEFGVEVKTITRNKIRLVNKLKVILFSDDTIIELFM